jgi:type IV secretory pathway VirB2 component (pilin)
MSKDMPIIFTMFGLVVVSLTILGIAWYYGENDWTWIAQSNASLVLVLMVLGIAFVVLVGWLKGRR